MKKDFYLLWFGQILSQSGGRMYQMAVIWWILSYQKNNSGLFLGLFMVMAALPSLLLVKWTGPFIDSYSSQKILVRADLFNFVFIGIGAYFLLTGWESNALPFFAIGFLAASVQALLDPTLNKAVEEVVDKNHLEKAVSLLTSTQSIANFAGAAFGAFLIDSIGMGRTALMAASWYLLSALATRITKFHFLRRITPEDTTSAWELLKSQPVVKKVLLGFGFVNFFVTPTLVVLPLYIKKTLEGSATLMGQLEACLWIGLIGGTLSAAKISISENRIRLSAICLAVLASGLLIPGIWVSAGVYAVSLFLVGFALGVNNVKCMSWFQEVIESRWKGRFFSLMQAVIGFSFPIAFFVFGFIGDYASAPILCLIQGVGVFVLALVFFKLSEIKTTALKLELQT